MKTIKVNDFVELNSGITEKVLYIYYRGHHKALYELANGLVIKKDDIKKNLGKCY